MRTKGFGCVLVAAVVAASVRAGVAEADKPSYGCPPGFDLGAYTFEQYLQLPRTVAAINAGLIDAETVLAGLARFDHNGNEVVCVQLPLGFEVGSRPFGQYFYNVVDDNSSVP
jgi:hypothetical protein